MATRQYVGARYVPKYFDDGTGDNSWKPNIPYEALTIVTRLNGTYTSKIPVPASVGAPEENPHYWVLSASYNAQFEEYRQLVERYMTEVQGVVEDVEELDGRIDGLEDGYYVNVVKVGADPTGATDSTQAIQTALNTGKVVIFPKGTYICNSANIPSNRTLIGYEAELVTDGNNILKNASNGVTGGYDAAYNIVIRGLRFTAPRAEHCSPLALSHCSNIKVENCLFHDILSWHFLELNACEYAIVRGCKFIGYGDESHTDCTEMLQLDSPTDEIVFPWFGPYDRIPCKNIEITGCSFYGRSKYSSSGLGYPAGIGNHNVASAQYVNIHHNYFNNLFSALRFTSLDNSLIADNIIENCLSGVYFGADGGHAENKILDNFMHGDYNVVDGTDHGAYTYCRGVQIWYNSGNLNNTISGNYIENFSSHGITAQGASNTIENNLVRACGGAGIYVGYNSSKDIVANNSLKGNCRYAAIDAIKDFYVNVFKDSNYGNEVLGGHNIHDNTCETFNITPTVSGSNPVLPSIIKNNTSNSFTTSDNYNFVYSGNLSDYTGVPNFATNAGDVSCPIDTWTKVGSINVPAGSFSVAGSILMDGASGSVTIQLTDGDSGREGDKLDRVTHAVVAVNATYSFVAKTVSNAKTNKTYNLFLYNATSSTITVHPRFGYKAI